MRGAAVSFVIVVALAAAGCGSVGRVTSGDPGAGKELFQKNCGSCHTLAAAGTSGTIGPNLDQSFKYARDQGFSQSSMADVVRGQIAYANPPMQRNIVTGEDADDVALYVAQVAGKLGAGGGQTVGTNGKAIFNASCASCHTLADAGATGKIGPSLDDLEPDAARVAKQVTNGGAQMPSFKATLSAAQIQAVAKYVASAAGK